MSDAVRLLLVAGCSGLAGILLCTMFAAVELHMARQRYNITNGPLPPDTQRAAWQKTARSIGVVGLVCLCIVVYRDTGGAGIVCIVSYLVGAGLRVQQAYADLAQ